MSPVLTRHAPEPVRRLRSVATPVVAAVVLVASLAALFQLVEEPAMVDTVVVDNRSAFAVEVGVAEGPGAGELPLAAVDPRSSARVDEVFDQGSTWDFRVTRAGAEIGTLSRDRDQLEGDGWRVVIPAAWAERLPAASG